jgi:hypothetical protein
MEIGTIQLRLSSARTPCDHRYTGRNEATRTTTQYAQLTILPAAP